MQHPELLLCFSGPVGLLLVQIPFPAVFCCLFCQLTMAPSLLGAWAGVAPGTIPGAISSVTCGQLEGFREPPVLAGAGL